MNKGATSIFQIIALGASGIVATIAMAYAQSTSSNLKETNDVVAIHTTEISQLKDSACVQNSNIQNIAAAVHASFVPDPHCK